MPPPVPRYGLRGSGLFEGRQRTTVPWRSRGPCNGSHTHRRWRPRGPSDGSHTHRRCTRVGPWSLYCCTHACRRNLAIHAAGSNGAHQPSDIHFGEKVEGKWLRILGQGFCWLVTMFRLEFSRDILRQHRMHRLNAFTVKSFFSRSLLHLPLAPCKITPRICIEAWRIAKLPVATLRVQLCKIIRRIVHWHLARCK